MIGISPFDFFCFTLSSAILILANHTASNHMLGTIEGVFRMTSVDQMIAELDQAREIMRTLLRDLEATHAASRELYPTWTIKELLAHITGWDDACIASLEAHSQGDVPTTPAARGIDLYNQSTVAERESLPLDQIIREWELTREVFKHFIRTLPPEKVDQPFVFPWGPKGSLVEMVKVFAEHEQEHAEEVRRMLSVAGGQ
jgi:hypothetical protein